MSDFKKESGKTFGFNLFGFKAEYFSKKGEFNVSEYENALKNYHETLNEYGILPPAKRFIDGIENFDKLSEESKTILRELVKKSNQDNENLKKIENTTDFDSSFMNSQMMSSNSGTLDLKLSYDEIIPNKETKLKIYFINPQTRKLVPYVNYVIGITKEGNNIFGPTSLHSKSGSLEIPVKFPQKGIYSISLEINEILFTPLKPSEVVSFNIFV